MSYHNFLSCLPASWSPMSKNWRLPSELQYTYTYVLKLWGFWNNSHESSLIKECLRISFCLQTIWGRLTFLADDILWNLLNFLTITITVAVALACYRVSLPLADINPECLLLKAFKRKALVGRFIRRKPALLNRLIWTETGRLLLPLVLLPFAFRG